MVYHQKKWSEDYQNTVRTRLETYVLPDIGDKDVTELPTGDLLVPIKRLKSDGVKKAVNREYVDDVQMIVNREWLNCRSQRG